jgi:hypothetical protein
MTTGAFVRAKREGRWQPIEIDQLTDAELDRYLDTQPRKALGKWVSFLARWIRDHVREQP